MNSHELKLFVWRSVISIVAALLLSSPASRAQNKDTLWTLVTAQGNNIVVTWDKNHPWDQQLSTQAADLVAEYQTKAQGWVRETLGRANSRNDRTYRYTLPNAVKAEPVGDICLYVQPAGSRGLLPVRSVQKGRDTARFRYEAWERVVGANSGVAAARQRQAVTAREIKDADQSIAKQEADLAQRGWTSAPACQAITVAATQDEPQPYDVAPVAQHDELARRVCVRRVWHDRARLNDDLNGLQTLIKQGKANAQLIGEVLDFDSRFDYLAPEAAESILAMKPPASDTGGDFDTRQAQAREFLGDWKKWESSSEQYFPHFGSADDYLMLVTSAWPIGFRWKAPVLAKAIGAETALPPLQQLSENELLGLVGAALDAYDGCVEDGRKQLKTKYDSWQALQTSAAGRDREKRDFFVRECTQSIGKLEEMKRSRKDLQDQLARDQQSLTSSSSTALPTRSQVLNTNSCNQP